MRNRLRRQLLYWFLSPSFGRHQCVITYISLYFVSKWNKNRLRAIILHRKYIYHTVIKFGSKKLWRIWQTTAICQVFLQIFPISITLPVVSQLPVSLGRFLIDYASTYEFMSPPVQFSLLFMALNPPYSYNVAVATVLPLAIPPFSFI